MNARRNILVVRLSAMGDVAISTPLIKAYASANSNDNFYMVSQPKFEAMLQVVQKIDPCSNLHFIPLNTKHGATDYEGSWLKLIKFAIKIKRQYGITHFADIHDVLRTKVLRMALRLCGVKVAKIDKHRADRSALCRTINKKFAPIIKSQRCMEEVFIALGFKDLHLTEANGADVSVLSLHKQNDNDSLNIGIAPFAAHKGKEWSIEKMEEVVKTLSVTSPQEFGIDKNRFNIFLYGGGKREVEILSSWSEKYRNVELIAGRYSLTEEITSMVHLDVMVSMDSANMHLASLVGTPVVSVWGATHKYAGYNGWGQSDDNAVEVDLPCRPCSIFGSKQCFKKASEDSLPANNCDKINLPYACLNLITPKMVIDKIVEVLKR